MSNGEHHYRINTIEDDMKQVKEDISTLKAVVYDTSHDVKWLKKILGWLATLVAAPIIVGLFTGIGILLWKFATL